MLTYEQLSADEFRLLNLKPLSFTPPPRHSPDGSLIEIYCTLTPSARELPPVYTTLSYVWGTSKTRKHVCVNDVLIEVGPNLESALRYLRLPDQDLVLWIDAICINQRYSKEQAAQVRHMRSIYANSLKTIVWLSPPVDEEGGLDFDLSVETMNEIGEKMITAGAVDAIVAMGNASGADPEVYENLVRDVDERLDLIFIKEDGKPLRALMAGFRFIGLVPYWTRVWTQQELAVANDVVFAIGYTRIAFPRFRACVLFMGFWHKYMVGHIIAKSNRGEEVDVDYWVKDFFRALPSVAAKPIGLRSHYQQDDDEQKFGLFHLLVRAHVTSDDTPRCQSTLSVDRIFALMGVAKDAEKLSIEIDYEAPTEVVYTNVARALIEAGHVDLLAYCQFHALEFEDAVLLEGKIVHKPVEKAPPSWVPDWRRELRRPCGEYTWDSAFRASGAQAYELLPRETTQPFEVLKLHGTRIDVIEETGHHWRPATVNTPPLELIAPYLAEIQNFCLKSNSKQETSNEEIYVNIGDRADAHYRTPIADQEMTNVGYRRRASPSAQEGYMKVLADTQGTPNLADPSIDKNSYLNMMGYLYFRRTFLSEKGFVGLGPEIVEVGDVICVFLGARLPYILRPRKEDGSFRLIGEAYVHGIMYGETWKSEEPPLLEIFELR